MKMIVYTASLMMTVLSCACREAAASHESPPKESKVNEREVTLTPELAKQVRIGQAPVTPVANEYTVSGRVDADETLQARVGTPIAGRLTELLVREGDPVRKGQVIALLTSNELTNLQFAFLKAHSQATLLERAVDRAQQLLAAGVIGSAELQRRQTELAQASAEMATLRGQLKVLGMQEDAANTLEQTRKVDATSQIVASIDGIVLERRATVGQVVQPADPIFVLADLSNVWLVADVPEQAAGNLTEGLAVEAEVTSLPGQTIRGRLSHVHAILDPQTRTLRVHMDVDNPQRKLKPGMLATMTLREAAATRRVVPITAIVREDNREFVFVQSAADKVVMREVELGDEFENRRVVQKGLQPKDKLVLDGAFHLNNERKRLALQKGAR